MPCTEKLKVKYPKLCVIKVINDSIYCAGTVSISNTLSIGLHVSIIKVVHNLTGSPLEYRTLIL